MQSFFAKPRKFYLQMCDLQLYADAVGLVERWKYLCKKATHTMKDSDHHRLCRGKGDHLEFPSSDNAFIKLLYNWVKPDSDESRHVEHFSKPSVSHFRKVCFSAYGATRLVLTRVQSDKCRHLFCIFKSRHIDGCNEVRVSLSRPSPRCP